MSIIAIEELITKYLSFYSAHESDIARRENINSAILGEFFDRFDLSTISLDEYCFEKGNDDSYCYWVDYQLNDLCDLHVTKTGAFQKFHIQKYNGGYKFMRKGQKNNWAGNDEDAVFKNVIEEILKIIRASKELSEENLSIIEESRLYEPFKAKLTYIYSPNLWLPILVKIDIDNILNAFGIFISKNASLTRKRYELYKFYKTLTERGLTISTWHFMRFLYSEDGLRYIVKNLPLQVKLPSSKRKPNKNTKKDRKINTNNILAEELADLKAIEMSFSENDEIVDMDDFIKTEKRKTAIGIQGEEIVWIYLNQNRKNLRLSKIDAPCRNNQHNKHYDFSYIKDEKPFFIEVKSSSRKDNIYFEMSFSEYLFMKKCMSNGQDYKIYYVSNVFGTPIIRIINPELVENKMQTVKYAFKGIC